MSSNSVRMGVPGPRYDGTVRETDSVVLARRLKQISYGKNTSSYLNYLRHIPREQRFDGCPKTPDRYAKASRRCFDGMIRRWKIDVHGWSDAIGIVEERRRRYGIQSTISPQSSSSSMPIAHQLTPPIFNFCFHSPGTNNSHTNNYNLYRQF